jgi:predicted ferric reductase
MNRKTIFAWIAIALIGLLPVVLLFAFGPQDYSSPTHTLGQLAGLVGMTLFSLSFLLSTRAGWIEDLFDGLDKVYPVHAVLGATSLVLLLLHPLFLVLKYVPENITLAASYLIPGGALSVDFGIFALAGMILLLALTLYSKMGYQRWKLSHEFLGLFFILAVLHILLIRTTIARDYIFKGYYVYAIVVSVVGLVSFAYSLLRKRLFGKKYKLVKVTLINGCFELRLEPLGKGLRYRSGQFVFVTFQNRKVGKESHPFSIASPSGNKDMRLIIKSLGDFTGRLSDLREGDSVILEGPYGRFHQRGYADEVWVAGGIGITPFLGLAADLHHSKTGQAILYYSVKSKDEFVRLEELQAVAKTEKRFTVVPWTSVERGFLTVQELVKNAGPLRRKQFYLCGPPGLKAAIKGGLRANGVPASHIHDERFAFK